MSDKEVPHAVNFRLVSKVDNINTWVLYASAIITLYTLLVQKAGLLPTSAETSVALSKVLSILALFYLGTDIVQSYLFHAAEVVRKTDFIENSLSSNLAEDTSNNYYTNDNIPPGIYKLGVNCFENSFFTKSILLKMMTPMIVQCIIIIVLFVFLSLFIDQSSFAILLQVALPFTIFLKTVKVIVLYYNVKAVFNNFTRIFVVTSDDKKTPLIVDNVLLYEKNISWAGVQIDSNLFTKLNPSLSQSWDRLKLKYRIT